MKISRAWAMPNKWTFQIKPIAELLHRYGVGKGWIDPFCGSSELAEHRNDLSGENLNAQSHTKALDFICEFDSIENVVFDPPYTLRQVKECYEGSGHQFFQSDSQNAVRWTLERDAILERIKSGGLVISFGYSTTCMGKKRGFKIEEILMVSHGAAHYDTLVTVERKEADLFTTHSKEGR